MSILCEFYKINLNFMSSLINEYPEHIQCHYDTLNIHGLEKEQNFTEKHLSKLIEKRDKWEKLTSIENLEIWAWENLLKTIQEIHDKIDKIIRWL